MEVNWRWTDQRPLALLHDETLAENGGAAGLRDASLLESALARPQNLLAYGKSDAVDLAGAYGVGLAKNHAFVNGNQRAAFLSVGLVLALNGFRLTAAQAGATLTFMATAASALDEVAFASWIRADSAPRQVGSRCLNSACPVFPEAIYERRQRPGFKRRAHLAHQIQVVVQVVDAGQHRAQHFAAALQMVQVSA